MKIHDALKWEFLKCIFIRKYFMPNLNIKNINELNIKLLKKKGIKNIIFDLDQTLVYYRTDKMPDIIKNKFKTLKKEFTCCAVSNYNNDSKKRINREKSFSKKYSLPIIHSKYKKPNPLPYLQCMKLMKSHIDNTAMIGNSNLGDIIGANKLGLYTILIKSVLKKTPLHIIILNIGERIIFNIYKLTK